MLPPLVEMNVDPASGLGPPRMNRGADRNHPEMLKIGEPHRLEFQMGKQKQTVRHIYKYINLIGLQIVTDKGHGEKDGRCHLEAAPVAAGNSGGTPGEQR